MGCGHSGRAIKMDDWTERLEQLGTADRVRLVQGLLRAMGYVEVAVPEEDARQWLERVMVPAAGGEDLPRLVVGVARDPSAETDLDELEAFASGRRAGDRGMYVSPGGFSAEARERAADLSVPVMLLEPADLAERLRQHWGSLDPDTQALLQG